MVEDHFCHFKPVTLYCRGCSYDPYELYYALCFDMNVGDMAGKVADGIKIVL